MVAEVVAEVMVVMVLCNIHSIYVTDRSTDYNEYIFASCETNLVVSMLSPFDIYIYNIYSANALLYRTCVCTVRYGTRCRNIYLVCIERGRCCQAALRQQHPRTHTIFYLNLVVRVSVVCTLNILYNTESRMYMGETGEWERV